MNIYFLVEGDTEKKLYPSWLEYLIPGLQRVKFPDIVDKNNYYIAGNFGYPKIVTHAISKAIQHIQESGKYNYLVICFDADEETIEEREKYANDFINSNIDLPNIEVVPIIQNRCLETWLLGNRQLFEFDFDRPLEEVLTKYINYYDVSLNDPELMGDFASRNHADFHYIYLNKLSQANGFTYTKNFPRKTREQPYLEQLIKRVTDEPEHLKTFKKFIDFCNRIRSQLAE